MRNLSNNAVARIPIMVEWRRGYQLNAPRMYQSAMVIHPISQKLTSVSE